MRKKILGMIFIFILAGCATTNDLWKKPIYVERLTGFYLADKKNKLIATGENFAYATTVDEELKKAINLHDEIDMRMGLFDFEVDKINNFKGRFALYTNMSQQDLTEEELGKLADAGFTQKAHTHGLSLIKYLSGNRYILEGELQEAIFEKPYKVRIKEPHAYSSAAKKMVATPFTLAFDTFVVNPTAIFILSVMAFDSYGTTRR